VISLLTKIEEAFNYTWRINKTRTLAERFSNYLSVLMVGPVLVFAAIGTTASLLNSSVTQSLTSIESFGFALEFITKLVPYLLIILAFTFVYIFVPNQKVRILPALTGGIAAGVLWQSVGWVYAFVITQSSSKTAIYASFAILFFFMIWLYLNWLILLVGSSIAFYRQHPGHITTRDQTHIANNRQREHIALNVLFLIAENFYKKKPALNVEMLSQILKCSKSVIEYAIDNFEQSGILVQTDNSNSTYLPAVPLENLSVIDVYTIIRGNQIGSEKQSVEKQIGVADSLLKRIEQSTRNELADLTIKQLIIK
jgi:membrane protein